MYVLIAENFIVIFAPQEKLNMNTKNFFAHAAKQWLVWMRIFVLLKMVLEKSRFSEHLSCVLVSYAGKKHSVTKKMLLGIIQTNGLQKGCVSSPASCKRWFHRCTSVPWDHHQTECPRGVFCTSPTSID